MANSQEGLTLLQCGVMVALLIAAAMTELWLFLFLAVGFFAYIIKIAEIAEKSK